MNDQQKYLITKTILRYQGGTTDILITQISTNSIANERKRIIEEFDCKKVEFRFHENERSKFKVKHGKN